MNQVLLTYLLYLIKYLYRDKDDDDGVADDDDD